MKRAWNGTSTAEPEPDRYTIEELIEYVHFFKEKPDEEKLMLEEIRSFVNKRLPEKRWTTGEVVDMLYDMAERHMPVDYVVHVYAGGFSKNPQPAKTSTQTNIDVSTTSPPAPSYYPSPGGAMSFVSSASTTLESKRRKIAEPADSNSLTENRADTEGFRQTEILADTLPSKPAMGRQSGPAEPTDAAGAEDMDQEEEVG